MEPRILFLALTVGIALGARSQGGCPASVTDIDGNVYPVVQIGDRCWTAKNLTTAHYANGDSIPTGLSDGDWEFTSAGACTVYAFDPSNETTYGRLYNWFAVTDARNLCPAGWHASTDADWLAMELHLGMDPAELALWNWRGVLPNVGGQLKSTAGWSPPNTGATNSTGFAALPGGYAGYDQTFEFLISWGQFWTSSDNAGSGISRHLSSTEAGIDRAFNINQVGFSCRCVYDQLVGIGEEEPAMDLAVFPNPATDVLRVKWRRTAIDYRLMDALGRVVLDGRLVMGVNALDVGHLPTGFYLLQVDGLVLRVAKE